MIRYSACIEALYGDVPFVERIEKVTPEDIMRVSQATFVPTNRTVAMIVNEQENASGAEGE